MAYFLFTHQLDVGVVDNYVIITFSLMACKLSPSIQGHSMNPVWLILPQSFKYSGHSFNAPEKVEWLENNALGCWSNTDLCLKPLQCVKLLKEHILVSSRTTDCFTICIYHMHDQWSSANYILLFVALQLLDMLVRASVTHPHPIVLGQ